MSKTASVTIGIETKKPNKETLQVFRDSDEGINLVTTNNLNDLYNQLGL